MKGHFASVSDALAHLYKECSLDTKNFIKKVDLKLILTSLELPSLQNNELTELIANKIMKR